MQVWFTIYHTDKSEDELKKAFALVAPNLAEGANIFSKGKELCFQFEIEGEDFRDQIIDITREIRTKTQAHLWFGTGDYAGDRNVIAILTGR